MSAFFGKIGAALGVGPSFSETDQGIIEAMIEIGADVDEIAETFGYSPEVIQAVKLNQPSSPYRVSPGI